VTPPGHGAALRLAAAIRVAPSRRASTAVRRSVALLGVLGVVLLIRRAAVSTYLVETRSMEPTLGRGSPVLIDKLSRHWSPIHRNDLVVFRSNGDLALKRVVGVEADVVTVKDGVLWVNGAPVREPYVDRASVDGTYLGRVVVPAGHLFVLGDRREGSIDSRTYGPISLDQVQGRVLLHW
jgi:signal peptidase I